MADANGNVDLHAALLERDLDYRIFSSVPLFDLVFLGTFRLLEGREVMTAHVHDLDN